MKWSGIAASEPALGAVAQDALIGPGVLLVGTVRRDGSPRISGAEPLVMDGELLLSMMRDSAKAADLARDRRILLHNIVTGPGPAAEVKIRGTVRAASDPGLQRRYAELVATRLGWRPVPGEFTLLAVDVEDVAYIGFDPETRGQHVARWPAGVEYVRPMVTPTSLGPSRPVRRLLA